MENIELHRNRAEAQSPSHSSGGSCACGEHNEGVPELDVQTIPHAVRHAAIFGVLDALRPGFSVILSATHDPVPLLQQLEARAPGAFDVNYLDRGPERWRIKVLRLDGAASA